MIDLVLIGGDSARFNSFLNNGVDPCFGKCYALSARECRECTTPVVLDGRFLLLNDVCRALTAASKKPVAQESPKALAPATQTPVVPTVRAVSGPVSAPPPSPELEAVAELHTPNPARIKKLPYRDVMYRLQEGRSVLEIFLEILDEGTLDSEGPLARTYLYGAFWYIEKSLGLPVPKLPVFRELAALCKKSVHGRIARNA